MFQNRQVYVRDQLKQGAVLRNFLLVHRRHSLRKMFPNIISRDGVRHGVMPPVNITWSVEKPVPSGGKNLRFVILRRQWSNRVLPAPVRAVPGPLSFPPARRPGVSL